MYCSDENVAKRFLTMKLWTQFLIKLVCGSPSKFVIYNVYVQCASCNRFFQVLLKYLKCQSETHLSEEYDETICTIEDGEIFSSAENLTLT